MKKRNLLKKFKCACAVAVIGSLLVPCIPQNGVEKVQAASQYQMEALDRGLVGVNSNGGIFLSWRLLGTEDYTTSFNVYRNGIKIAGPITNSTNYFDASGTTSASYYVRTVINNAEVTQSDTITPWSKSYLDVPISKPANTTLSGATVTYSANDATVADVDGDGKYEIILKWDPSNSKDNSQSGYTSNVYIDCYELDGTMKWRIDLGKNIRAGAHYTQMIAYDLNGDGKAEVALKTADGTIDGTGAVIGNASADYRNSKGYILSGPEYLTIFEGATGKNLKTITYEPARGSVSDWGDSYGNRVDRFLSGVAYLDGKTPSLIICRGYYAKSCIVAYQFKSGSLTKQWTFTADGSNNSSYRAQGAHSLSIADVDNDGYDEIVYGSAVIDHTGKGLYSTGQGHGDALHCGDFDPNHAGQEIFMVHESKSSSVESVQMRDAKTGKTLWSYKRSADIGRGLIINAAAEFAPYVCLADYAYNSSGSTITNNLKSLGENFSMLWDADLLQEGLDGNSIRKWNSSTKKVDIVLQDTGIHSNNTTKATPSLSGDILGDWREEVIWPTSSDTALRIYTTTAVTTNKLYTLMHDRQYREAIAWQNVAYNQPPHASYYIGTGMSTPVKPSMYTVGTYKEKTVGTVVTPTPSAATVEEGLYMIKNVNSGLYMDVAGGTAANSTNVQQWGASSAASYNTWKVVSTGDGYYKLYSQVGDGNTYVLDIAGMKTADGTNVLIYTDKGSSNQMFKFVKNSDGTYGILSKLAGDVSGIEIASSSTGSGGNVQLYQYTGSANQKWTLEKVTLATPTPVVTPTPV
ncbi:rhamnogalacturonan lyase family protein, partial [Anaeromicropila populeti]